MSANPPSPIILLSLSLLLLPAISLVIPLDAQKAVSACDDALLERILTNYEKHPLAALQLEQEFMENDGGLAPETVRSAYRKLALKCHPDKCKDPRAGTAVAALNSASQAVLHYLESSGLSPRMAENDAADFSTEEEEFGFVIHGIPREEEAHILLVQVWDVNGAKELPVQCISRQPGVELDGGRCEVSREHETAIPLGQLLDGATAGGHLEFRFSYTKNGGTKRVALCQVKVPLASVRSLAPHQVIHFDTELCWATYWVEMTLLGATIVGDLVPGGAEGLVVGIESEPTLGGDRWIGGKDYFRRLDAHGTFAFPLQILIHPEKEVKFTFWNKRGEMLSTFYTNSAQLAEHGRLLFHLPSESIGTDWNMVRAEVIAAKEYARQGLKVRIGRAKGAGMAEPITEGIVKFGRQVDVDTVEGTFSLPVDLTKAGAKEMFRIQFFIEKRGIFGKKQQIVWGKDEKFPLEEMKREGPGPKFIFHVSETMAYETIRRGNNFGGTGKRNKTQQNGDEKERAGEGENEAEEKGERENNGKRADNGGGERQLMGADEAGNGRLLLEPAEGKEENEVEEEEGKTKANEEGEGGGQQEEEKGEVEWEGERKRETNGRGKKEGERNGRLLLWPAEEKEEEDKERQKEEERNGRLLLGPAEEKEEEEGNSEAGKLLALVWPPQAAIKSVRNEITEKELNGLKNTGEKGGSRRGWEPVEGEVRKSPTIQSELNEFEKRRKEDGGKNKTGWPPAEGIPTRKSSSVKSELVQLENAKIMKRVPQQNESELSNPIKKNESWERLEQRRKEDGGKIKLSWPPAKEILKKKNSLNQKEIQEVKNAKKKVLDQQQKAEGQPKVSPPVMKRKSILNEISELASKGIVKAKLLGRKKKVKPEEEGGENVN